MSAPFTRVIDRRDFERILGERDPDEAYRDAVFAEIRDGLPRALCWFFGAMLVVLVPAVVWMEWLS